MSEPLISVDFMKRILARQKEVEEKEKEGIPTNLPEHVGYY